MEASIEDKFNAAVNVIRGLPKNGSYQPSNEMLLRFYSYFKQATLGPCTQKKPAFWDVVNKAKWDAWKRLGNMDREKAMVNYVNELKKIIETMSYTDNVAQFMGSIGELDGVDVNDLETVAPEVMKVAKSYPNSPFASRETSPQRVNGNGLSNGTTHIGNGMMNGNTNGYINGYGDNNHNGIDYSYQNGHNNSVEHSDDEYIDTVEDESEFNGIPPTRGQWNRAPVPHVSRARSVQSFASRTSEDHLLLIEVKNIVDQMNVDLQGVNHRLVTMERSLTEIKNLQLRREIMTRRHPNWWPFKDISPNWFVIMIVWPFVVQRLIRFMEKRRK